MAPQKRPQLFEILFQSLQNNKYKCIVVPINEIKFTKRESALAPMARIGSATDLVNWNGL